MLRAPTLAEPKKGYANKHATCHARALWWLLAGTATVLGYPPGPEDPSPACTHSKPPPHYPMAYPRNTMKKLNVTIQLEMTVPDDWALVETSEGTPVIQMADGKFLDIAIEPLFATDPEDMWSSTDSEEELHEVLDMVESEAVTYEFVTH
jgi:hypothetical protein